MEPAENVAGVSGRVFCSLVIPCYNEEGNIPSLVKGFAGALEAGDFELIIVDNGSADSSPELLKGFARKFPFLRVVSVPENIGYGHGICQGLKAARGEYVGWAHGDMQYDPAEIMKAVEALRPERGRKLFLKGLRSGRSFSEVIFTAGMAAFESLLFGEPLWDINAQPTLFHRSLLKNWAGAPSDFLLDLYAYALAVKKGLLIKRFGLAQSERTRGSSSWNRSFQDRLRLSVLTAMSSLRVRRSVSGGRKDVP